MIAMAISGAFFGALIGGGIRLGMERGDGWTRQVLLTPLSGPGYLGAKAITAWLLTLPAVVVVFLLGGLVNGVSIPALRWIAVALVIWVSGLVFVAAGLAIGLVAAGESAQFVALAVFFPLAMLGGLWFPIDSFPSGLREVAEFLPTRALYRLADQVAAGAGAGLLDGRADRRGAQQIPADRARQGVTVDGPPLDKPHLPAGQALCRGRAPCADDSISELHFRCVGSVPLRPVRMVSRMRLGRPPYARGRP
jgi:hypothetical protein